MMKRNGLCLFGVALLLSIVRVPAVEGIKLAVQGSNAIVTWPSAEGETYIVQHRASLHNDTLWMTLTANLSAALNTNHTTFVHTGIVIYPACTNGGGGTAEGPPPSPSGSSSATSSSTSEYEGREPYTWERENRPPFPWDPEMEERRQARKSDALMTTSSTETSTQSVDPECQPTMGFYRVVRNGIHLFGVTNGMSLSGTVKIAVEVGSDLGTLQTVTLSANGQDVLRTEPLSAPFTSPYLYFEVDTAALNNGGQTLQARATFLVPQTNTFDSPYVTVSSIPVTVNVSNEILYPNWVTEFSEDSLFINVSTVHLNSSWEVDVYGSAEDYSAPLAGPRRMG